MFHLERVQKLKITCSLLCIFFLILAIAGFFRGGSILLFTGKLYKEEGGDTFLMAISGVLFLVFLLGAAALHLLQKDITEYLKYLNSRNNSKK